MELCSARKGIHKFEARYDEVPNTKLIERSTSMSGNRNILILKVYVKDICINCGAEIKK